MTKRRKILIALLIGTPVVLVGLILLLVTALRPPLLEPVAPVEEKPIPSVWLAGSADDEQNGTPVQEEAPERQEGPSPPGIQLPFTSTGSLAFFGDGRPFGTESYRLTVSEEGATLSSTGHFLFKIVLATVRVTYTQTLQADDQLRPIDYTLDFNAPLGFGGEIHAQFSADTVTVVRKEGRETRSINPSRVLVLGTFSTYALVPALFEARAENGRANFDVLFFGGPPQQASPNQDEEHQAPVLTVQRLSDAILESDNVRLVVDRYRIQSELGDSLLFAKDEEFLGFLAGDGEETLLVYRSDYFPNGFTLGGEGEEGLDLES